MKRQNNTLIIAGSGRSGTTWIQDVLATACQYKTVFEPLHPAVGDISTRYSDKYIKAKSKQLEMKAFMDIVMNGELTSVWANYRVIPERLKPTLRTFYSPHAFLELYHRYRALWNNYRTFSDKKTIGVVVKFIRANLMLGWLSSQYDARILFVMRHPGAVIESKIRLDAAAKNAGLQFGTSDWNPHAVLNKYLNDKSFYNDYISRYTNELDFETLTDIEIHVVNWCLENAPVLEISAKYNICICCYEDLVVQGKDEWQRIVQELDLVADLNAMNMAKPSQQASHDFKNITTNEQKLARWMDRFSDDEKASMERILKIFKVNTYSAFTSMPINNNDDDFNTKGLTE